MKQQSLGRVDDAVEALARGEMIVLLDSPERENEGDLVIAAEHATADAINFMATHGRGLICVAMTEERLAALGIPRMVATNSDPLGTAFHVGVDVRAHTSTGISATDRAATAKALASPHSRGGDFSQPGHVFPLARRAGGVLRRPGHTEGSVDLAEMAGCEPAAVICEIAGIDGEMARLPALLEFAARYGLVTVAISELIAHRRRTDQLVERASESQLPLDAGAFKAIVYRDKIAGLEHVALVNGDLDECEDVLVRVHSECLTGDVFGSRRCDCGRQLDLALELIAAEGTGVVVYLRGHEGRGIGLADKIHAYRLQEDGLDTVEANIALGYPADMRDYGIAAQILKDLGVVGMRLLTNNPAKVAGLTDHGLVVAGRVPLMTEPLSENRAYLWAKTEKLGHEFDFEVALAEAWGIA